MTPRLILLLALVLLTVRQAVVESMAAAADADWMKRRRDKLVCLGLVNSGIWSVYLHPTGGQSRICLLNLHQFHRIAVEPDDALHASKFAG